MDAQQYLDLLKSHNAKESAKTDSVSDYSNAGDTVLKAKEVHSGIHKENPHHLHKEYAKTMLEGEKTPFSNDELHNFIQDVGFKADPVAQFSQIAEKLGLVKNRQDPDYKEDLTNLDGHDIIEDVSPIRKNNEAERNVHREALKQLITKYKG